MKLYELLNILYTKTFLTLKDPYNHDIIKGEVEEIYDKLSANNLKKEFIYSTVETAYCRDRDRLTIILGEDSLKYMHDSVKEPIYTVNIGWGEEKFRPIKQETFDDLLDAKIFAKKWVNDYKNSEGSRYFKPIMVQIWENGDLLEEKSYDLR